MDVKPAALLAVREALVMGDTQEAYHRLRVIADPDCLVALRSGGNHWADLEEAAIKDSLGWDDKPKA